MNLEEIAKLSNVSRSTVSRVVNNDPNVKEQTRVRVLQVIRQVNYRPNAAARSLAAGRSHILGLVIPTGVSALFTDPYFPILIQGVSSACNVHDHSVMLWLAEPEYERHMIGQITGSGLVDGVIVASALMDDPLNKAIFESDLPAIMVGQHPIFPNISYVDVDNRRGSQDIVTHLIRLGYRRIATITGPLNLIAGADRYEGYRAALKERGLTPAPEWAVEGDFTEAGGYGAMQRLLPHRPEAVFAASDIMALGSLRAVHDAGLRVPDDVAVVGFDDMPFAARTDPPLTTVRQPIYRTGVLAAETLIDMVAHPGSVPRRIVLPTELVIRSTCGANRNSDRRLLPLSERP
jgi:LacI family transcriptional regulator